MADKKKRYWVYEHDSDGDLIKDFGDFDSFKDALDTVGYQLQEAYRLDHLTWSHTIRIVDMNLQDEGTTIWLAGPVERDSEMRPVI